MSRHDKNIPSSGGLGLRGTEGTGDESGEDDGKVLHYEYLNDGRSAQQILEFELE